MMAFLDECRERRTGLADTKISTHQFSLFRREFVGGRDFGAWKGELETLGSTG